ncbi:DUF7673 family protein [Cupriavidus pampae]|nr:hypothetical protein [Cupriavidus pampae]
MPPAQRQIEGIPEAEWAAVLRLYELAQCDTDHGEVVAAFLLSWWSSSLCGGFPVSDACVD